MSSLRQFASETLGGLIGITLLIALTAGVGWLSNVLALLAKPGGSL